MESIVAVTTQRGSRPWVCRPRERRSGPQTAGSFLSCLSWRVRSKTIGRPRPPGCSTTTSASTQSGATSGRFVFLRTSRTTTYIATLPSLTLSERLGRMRAHSRRSSLRNLQRVSARGAKRWWNAEPGAAVVLGSAPRGSASAGASKGNTSRSVTVRNWAPSKAATLSMVRLCA